MRLYPATVTEIGWIVKELEKAKNHPGSGDFLEAFPWESTNWYGVDLDCTELENSFLFWDGSAWGESPHELPRRLTKGVVDFVRIRNDPSQSNNVHLKQIIYWLKKYEAGEMRNSYRFLILVGVDENSRLMFLDGSHRVSAALWWTTHSGDSSQLPLRAWIGFSPDMIDYWYYCRILLAE